MQAEQARAMIQATLGEITEVERRLREIQREKNYKQISPGDASVQLGGLKIEEYELWQSLQGLVKRIDPSIDKAIRGRKTLHIIVVAVLASIAGFVAIFVVESNGYDRTSYAGVVGLILVSAMFLMGYLNRDMPGRIIRRYAEDIIQGKRPVG